MSSFLLLCVLSALPQSTLEVDPFAADPVAVTVSAASTAPACRRNADGSWSCPQAGVVVPQGRTRSSRPVVNAIQRVRSRFR